MEKLIPAHTKDAALAQEIRAAKAAGTAEGFDLWWLGQSGFLLQWNQRCVLFDPYLSDTLTKKYADTDKPHIRMSERVIEPARLDMVDIVTSSHNHTDHLDAETLQPIFDANPTATFVIPEANRDFVAQRTSRDREFPLGMNEGDEVEVHGFTFHGLPAAHNEIERDEQGRCKFMGYGVRFGPFALYHSGDTLLYNGLAERLRTLRPDVALLPINGNDPARRVAGNLNAAEAVALAQTAGIPWVIPHHYHMFTFNTADPRHFEEEARRRNQPYVVARLGERITFPHS